MPKELEIINTGWEKNMVSAQQAVPTLAKNNIIILPNGDKRLLDPLRTKLFIRDDMGYVSPQRPTSYLGFIGNVDTQKESVIANYYDEFLRSFFEKFHTAWSAWMLGVIANIEEALSQTILYAALADPENISATAIQTSSPDTKLPTELGNWLAKHFVKQNQQGSSQNLISEVGEPITPDNPLTAELVHKRRNNILRLIAAMSGCLFVAHIKDLNDPTLLAIMIARKANRPVFFHETLIYASIKPYLIEQGCHGVEQPREMIKILEDLRKKKRDE